MAVARVSEATWTAALVLPVVIGVGYLATARTVSIGPYDTQAKLIAAGAAAAAFFVALVAPKIAQIASVRPTRWFGTTFLLTIVSTSVLLLFQSIEMWTYSLSDHHVVIGIWIAFCGAIIIAMIVLKFAAPIAVLIPALDFATVPIWLWLNWLHANQSPIMWCPFQQFVEVHAKYAVFVASANTLFLLVLLGMATQSGVLSWREFAMISFVAIIVVAFGLQHFYYSAPITICHAN